MPSPQTLKLPDQGDREDLAARAADALSKGGVVILPTETVYGAAALLSSPTALQRLRSLPPAAPDKPLVVHLPDPSAAERFIDPPAEQAGRLIRKLWPGPVAMVFEVSSDRCAKVCQDLGIQEPALYENGTLTLRCPDHDLTREALWMAGGPVVARRVPGGGGIVKESIGGGWADLVDLVLDAGPPRYSKPSTIIRVSPSGYQIQREGAWDRRIIERKLRTTILFVCSGNTCRSPMAEAIARKVLADRLGTASDGLEDRGVVVLSAGAMAFAGARATPQAIQAAAELGADLSAHRSRGLSVELINQADYIFTMGSSHRAAVAAMVPSALAKTQPLDPAGDIEDPIGGDVELYKSLARQMKVLIEKRLADVAL